MITKTNDRRILHIEIHIIISVAKPGLHLLRRKSYVKKVLYKKIGGIF